MVTNSHIRRFFPLLTDALTVLTLGLAIQGCASSSPRPASQLTRSHAAINAARDGGAEAVPSAAVHLQLARDQVEQAHHMIDNKQPDRAEYLLMRAEADAELALALAQEAPARALAQDALDQVQALEDSLEVQGSASAEDDAPQKEAAPTGPDLHLSPDSTKAPDPFLLVPKPALRAP